MPKSWERSEEQREYLDALVPKLAQARKDRRVKRFKNDLYEGWFARWPEEVSLFGNDWKEGDSLSQEDHDLLGLAIKVRMAVSFRLLYRTTIFNFCLATIHLYSVARVWKDYPLTNICSLEEIC
jgi:hypothetical protein